MEGEGDEAKLVFNEGSGTVPAPRKRDSIAREAERLLTNFDLDSAGVSPVAPTGALSGGAE